MKDKSVDNERQVCRQQKTSLQTMKDKSVDDEGIHVGYKEIGTEYYIQKLFNET